MTEIRPCPIRVHPADLADLARRLAATRWPERETVNDWSQGTPLEVLRGLVDHWQHRHDWRAAEARLNALGSSVTEIDGLPIHFLHIRSPEPAALPLVMTHGWPGSVFEFMRVIGPLTDPVAHGGRAGDAFHLVLPSLPGYGFSGKPTATGWGVERIASAWSKLMERLGYSRWAAQGGDWGAFVTYAIGAQAPPGCIGIHVNMPIAGPTAEARANPTPQDRHAFERMAFYKAWDMAYAVQQGTRPQTLGYGLVDSPVGLAGWIYEKIQGWSDNPGSAIDVIGIDAILDNIALYWFTASGASAARLYWESFGKSRPQDVFLPAAVSAFPGDILPAPRAWVEKRLKNLVYWNEVSRGGHFAAWEQTSLFVAELRAAFVAIRAAGTGDRAG